MPRGQTQHPTTGKFQRKPKGTKKPSKPAPAWLKRKIGK